MIRSSLFVFPLALLAPVAVGCSSSSGGSPTKEAGTTDTGSTHHDTGTSSDTGTKTDAGTHHDSGTTHEAGSKDVFVPTDGSNVPMPVPAAGSVNIAKGIRDVRGVTDDGYVAFYDATGGISVADVTGAVTQIAGGPTTDGGLGPDFMYPLGNFVFYTANYTTHTVSGNTQLLDGDLYVWSHAIGTKGVKLASKGVGQVFVAPDSSAIAYLDGAEGTTATYGNLGVVLASQITASGATGTDVLTGIVIDENSSTCAPYAQFDQGTLVVTACKQIDGGNSHPILTAFTGASWTPTLLLADAAASSIAKAPVSINFGVDTSGHNALALGASVTGDGGTKTPLSIQPLTSATETTLTPSYGAPSGGSASFYLAPDSSFALFTEPSGVLGKATFTGADPTTAVITNFISPNDAGVGGAWGLIGVAPDAKHFLTYDTAIDPATGAPTSLNLVTVADGTSHALVTAGNAIASPFGGLNSWTSDSSYVIFTTNLVAVPNMQQASIGTLKTAKVADGTVNTLVSNLTVWDAEPAGGTKLVYNQAYVPSMFTNAPNGAAMADLYTADATMASPGTLLASGADATFYVTKDGKHLFYSFTQLELVEGGTVGVAVPGDGIYVVALP